MAAKECKECKKNHLTDNDDLETEFAQIENLLFQDREGGPQPGSCYFDWIGESLERILSVADSRCPVASTRCPTAPSPKGGML
jgi:hypothetical protein